MSRKMPAMFPLLYLSILPLFPIYPIFLFSFLFGFTHCLSEEVREWMKLISLDLPKFIWICDFLFFYISMCINNLFFNIFSFFFKERKMIWKWVKSVSPDLSLFVCLWRFRFHENRFDAEKVCQVNTRTNPRVLF